MSFLDRLLPAQFTQNRRDQQELGQGIWRQTNGRFIRSIDRYHQLLEGIPDIDANRAVRDELVDIGNTIADRIDQVRTICCTGQSLLPTDDPQLPYGSTAHNLADAPRRISKASNLVAQAAEAVAMARVQLNVGNTMLAHLRAESAARAVAQACEHLDAADSAIQSIPSP